MASLKSLGFNFSCFVYSTQTQKPHNGNTTTTEVSEGCWPWNKRFLTVVLGLSWLCFVLAFESALCCSSCIGIVALAFVLWLLHSALVWDVSAFVLSHWCCAGSNFRRTLWQWSTDPVLCCCNSSPLYRASLCRWIDPPSRRLLRSQTCCLLAHTKQTMWSNYCGRCGRGEAGQCSYRQAALSCKWLLFSQDSENTALVHGSIDGVQGCSSVTHCGAHTGEGNLAYKWW